MIEPRWSTPISSETDPTAAALPTAATWGVQGLKMDRHVCQTMAFGAETEGKNDGN